ncbi:hypothetical protein T01_9631 [Trichinella spiralis]|uniref:Uncharacterized protein n=1 Tax=Trichinella spiralis TaxID=6334 RepID=A0A0V1AWM2_TRISP|nr:hypothetical protein T01_9631 [Trichinella spiralis]
MIQYNFLGQPNERSPNLQQIKLFDICNLDSILVKQEQEILWALVDMFRFDGFRSGQTTSWLVLLADIVFLTLIYTGHVLYS